MIEDQAQNAADILNRIKEFIEKRDSTRLRENLAQLIKDAVALARVRASGRQISIRFQSSRDDIEVDVDRVQIQQVLVNFLRNASDAMADQADPEITIETLAERPGLVRVNVYDNGPGIDPMVADRLFTPFVTTKTFGMGVGLSLCKTIVQNHGGETAARPVRRKAQSFGLRCPPSSGRKRTAVKPRVTRRAPLANMLPGHHRFPEEAGAGSSRWLGKGPGRAERTGRATGFGNRRRTSPHWRR